MLDFRCLCLGLRCRCDLGIDLIMRRNMRIVNWTLINHLMMMFDCLEVTRCSWQDIKIWFIACFCTVDYLLWLGWETSELRLRELLSLKTILPWTNFGAPFERFCLWLPFFQKQILVNWCIISSWIKGKLSIIDSFSVSHDYFKQLFHIVIWYLCVSVHAVVRNIVVVSVYTVLCGTVGISVHIV